MIDYRVKLDPDRTNFAMRKGRPHKMWFGREIMDEKNLCTYGPYEFLYGKYCSNDDEKVVLYKRHQRRKPQQQSCKALHDDLCVDEF